jgi:hypothetical protein
VAKGLTGDTVGCLGDAVVDSAGEKVVCLGVEGIALGISLEGKLPLPATGAVSVASGGGA